MSLRPEIAARLTAEERDMLRSQRTERKAKRRKNRMAAREQKKAKYGEHCEIVTITHRGADQHLTIRVKPATVRTITADTFNFQLNKHEVDGFEIKLQVKQPTHYYLEWFWGQLRAGRLPVDLMLKLFPDPKEQSESTSALFQLNKRVNLSTSLIVVVADGGTPRTASLFVLKHPQAQVHSIDPDMRVEWLNQTSIPNLKVHRCLIEEWVASQQSLLASATYQRLVIVAVHSHALFKNYVPQMAKAAGQQRPITILAIPCCYYQGLSLDDRATTGINPTEDVIDWGIQSEKRRLLFWQR